MDITHGNLSLAFKGFQARFGRAFEGAKVYHPRLAMEVPSSSESETYGWLGEFPQLREWIGDRIVKELDKHSFTIRNRLFESTSRVLRTHFEDDEYGLYVPMFDETGRLSRHHPDELMFALLANGFNEPCYDGQMFFDTDHPVRDENDIEQSVSNLADGADQPWYLLDTSRAIRPLIWQSRSPYRLQALNQDTDETVFMRDTYLYGVRARSNAGFGLWQIAYASRQTLNIDNYAAARAAMMSLRADGRRILGVMPDVLVVPPGLESAGRTVLNAITHAQGESNIWAGSAELIVAPPLAA